MDYVLSFLIGTVVGWLFCIKMFKIAYDKIIDKLLDNLNEEEIIIFEKVVDKIYERISK